jgi:hypothetical protein
VQAPHRAEQVVVGSACDKDRHHRHQANECCDGGCLEVLLHAFLSVLAAIRAASTSRPVIHGSAPRAVRDDPAMLAASTLVAAIR